MSLGEGLSRVSVDPRICFGKPCIKGHRIPVALILDMLATGSTPADLLRTFPGVTDADLLACIAYAAQLARVQFVDLPLAGLQ